MRRVPVFLYFRWQIGKHGKITKIERTLLAVVFYIGDRLCSYTDVQGRTRNPYTAVYIYVFCAGNGYYVSYEDIM